MTTSIAIQQEALSRATSSQSLANYAAIIRGFMAKGWLNLKLSHAKTFLPLTLGKRLGAGITRVRLA